VALAEQARHDVVKGKGGGARHGAMKGKGGGKAVARTSPARRRRRRRRGQLRSSSHNLMTWRLQSKRGTTRRRARVATRGTAR
jgi:hypothetical protein